MLAAISAYSLALRSWSSSSTEPASREFPIPSLPHYGTKVVSEKRFTFGETLQERSVFFDLLAKSDANLSEFQELFAIRALAWALLKTRQTEATARPRQKLKHCEPRIFA